MEWNGVKTAVVTFVYPAAESYYRETLQSIAEQTDQDFDTVVVDDKLGVTDCGPEVRILNNSQNLGLVPLREAVFNQLLDEEYDLLISIDADDTMSPDRVEATKRDFAKHPGAGFFYSPLYYMNDPEVSFFELPTKTARLEEILFYNFVGLSHTSLNLSATRKHGYHFKFPKQVIALDWYLASWYLSIGFEGRRTEGRTYYRLYDNNLAGQTSNASPAKVTRIWKVKEAHYEALLQNLPPSSERDVAKSELERLRRLLMAPPEEISKADNLRSHWDSAYWWAGY